MSKTPLARHIGDPHLMDPLVAVDKRGYPSVEAHDQAFCRTWRNSVPNDRTPVFVYGDISKGNQASWEHALSAIAELPGEKILVEGNHEPTHPCHRNGYKKRRQALEVFTAVMQHNSMRIAGRTVMQSHFPYEGDHAGTEERYLRHRLRDEGDPLVHAHVHDEWLTRLTNRDTLMVCVSWEQWPDLFPTTNDLARIIYAHDTLETS